MAIHSSILAWRIHGQRSLAGYSLWGHKESDVTEMTACVHAEYSSERSIKIFTIAVE